ncbi:olfactory receptor 5G9-like [Leptodactylus fuscus]
MCEENQTQVTQIRLLGFRGLHKYKPLLFIVFLLTYIFILAGNLLIILLVTTIDHLKTPMFYFLKHLSTADVLLTTTIVPVMLDIIFVEQGILPFWGCMIQFYFSGISGTIQCLIIAVMSYDRYLAICHPLRYSSLMGPDLCLLLVVGLWFIGNVSTSSEVFVVWQFKYCGQNSIDHFFCDFGPILELTTSDTSILRLQDIVTNTVIVFCPLVFIIVTYFCIFFTILKISSAYGKRKAFSTCSSHLTTVCVYYGSLITVYMVPADEGSSNINKYISLLYLILTPLMNPIIYSLRNNEMKRAMQKLISQIYQNGWKRLNLSAKVAVLSQMVGGEEHPVTHLNRKLTPPEKKYSIVEWECLAIKWALESLSNLVMEWIPSWISTSTAATNQGHRWQPLSSTWTLELISSGVSTSTSSPT